MSMARRKARQVDLPASLSPRKMLMPGAEVLGARLGKDAETVCMEREQAHHFPSSMSRQR